MKILIFDTETSGLSCENNDILQLSYQIVEIPSFTLVEEVERFFAWPEDHSRVEEKAISVNGLTEEYLATKVLSDRKEAMVEFYSHMKSCDMLVAHNGCFDQKFIDATAEREGVDVPEWKPMTDTMLSTTDLCQLPPHPGKTGFKYPKLCELAQFLSVRMDDLDLHNSSSDVELTKRCFQELVKRGFYEGCLPCSESKKKYNFVGGTDIIRVPKYQKEKIKELIDFIIETEWCGKTNISYAILQGISALEKEIRDWENSGAAALADNDKKCVECLRQLYEKMPRGFAFETSENK